MPIWVQLKDSEGHLNYFEAMIASMTPAMRKGPGRKHAEGPSVTHRGAATSHMALVNAHEALRPWLGPGIG